MNTLFSLSSPEMLYIHWPFCAAKCHYCDFVAMQDHHSFSETYHRALCNEIRSFAARRPQLKAHPIKTIFFGGGTPSLYPLPLLEELFALLHEVFDCSSLQEVTLEVNPDETAPSKLAAWKALGITRLSVGVQVLDDAVLARLNRPQTRAQVEELFAQAPQHFSQLSADCIIGLPGVSAECWKQTIEAAMQWNLSHVSVYFLTVHEHTPLYHGVRAGRIALPKDERILDDYAWTIDALSEAGFEQYEISNFARPGGESLHNRGYWQRHTYYGFGLGAASFDGVCRAANKKKLGAYCAHFSSADAESEGWYEYTEKLTDEQHTMEELMLGLRQAEGVDLHHVVYCWSSIQKQLFDRVTKQLSADGYLNLDGTRVRLTRKGRIFENEVVAQLCKGIEGARSNEKCER
jgi:oxygen-independent coproporphyrinogen-3 oxidase